MSFARKYLAGEEDDGDASIFQKYFLTLFSKRYRYALAVEGSEYLFLHNMYIGF